MRAAVLVSIVLLLGSSAAASADTVDIGGGRTMFLECRGKGGPTVVLISGLADRAGIWSTTTGSAAGVLARTARFTRVCAYDRPGTRTDSAPTRSTPVRQPVTPRDGAADLERLLKAARVPGPYVLVGHSYGGAIARIYASEHPRDVAGLVLVDALSEDLARGLTPEQLAIFEALNDPQGQPPTAERIAFRPIARELRAARSPGVPTVVLTADRPQLTPEAIASGELPPAVDQAFADALWGAQIAAQDSLARRYPGSTHVTKTNSTHYIQSEQPQLVTRWIRSVVRRARR